MKTLKTLPLFTLGFWLFAFPSSDGAQQAEKRVRLTENSDWWSGLRSEDEDVGKTQEREIPASNFKIAGVVLGERFFEQATTKLGRTTVVDRGDASSGREQVCY